MTRFGKMRSTGRWAIVALALIIVVAIATVSFRAEMTAANWADEATVTSGTFVAYALPQPVILSGTAGCKVEDAGPEQKKATITWSAISTPYVLDYTAGVVDPQTNMNVAGSGTTRSVVFSKALMGTIANRSYTIRLRAKLPAPNGGWVSVATDQVVTVSSSGATMICGTDTTGPSISFTAPTNNGSSVGNGALQTTVRNACGSRRPGCGTVTDPSGVANVTFSLKRVNLGLTRYFYRTSESGGAYGTDSSQQPASVNGTTWSFDGLITSAYISGGDYTLVVKATDNFGNLTTATINFTLT